MSDINRHPDSIAQQNITRPDFYDCQIPRQMPTDKSGQGGNANERTQHALSWSDTTWSLAAAKYNDFGTKQLDAIEAIYELNGMTPKVVMKNGSQELIAPRYGAGQQLILPAESEIQDLRRKFWERMAQKGIQRVPRTENESPIVAATAPTAGTDSGTGRVNPPPTGTDGGTGTVNPPTTGTDGGTGRVNPPPTGTDGGTGTVNPPSGGTDGPTPPKPNQLEILAHRLETQHTDNVSTFEKARAENGVLGKTFDGLKNTVGTSWNNASINPLTWHSALVDSDRGSDATKAMLDTEGKQLADLKQAAKEGKAEQFNDLYFKLTGNRADSKDTSKTLGGLKSSEAVSNYATSQHNGIEFIADTGAIIGATMLTKKFSPTAASTMRLMMYDAAGTGIGKYGIKSLAQENSDLWRDGGSGAMLGLLAKPAEMLGGKVSNYFAPKWGMQTVGESLLENRIATAGLGWKNYGASLLAKEGTMGGVYGGAMPWTQEFIDTVGTDHKFDGWGTAKRSIIGIPTGVLFGTALGAPTRKFFGPKEVPPGAAPDAPITSGTPDVPSTSAPTTPEVPAARASHVEELRTLRDILSADTINEANEFNCRARLKELGFAKAQDMTASEAEALAKIMENSIKQAAPATNVAEGSQSTSTDSHDSPAGSNTVASPELNGRQAQLLQQADILKHYAQALRNSDDTAIEAIQKELSNIGLEKVDHARSRVSRSEYADRLDRLANAKTDMAKTALGDARYRRQFPDRTPAMSSEDIAANVARLEKEIPILQRYANALQKGDATAMNQELLDNGLGKHIYDPNSGYSTTQYSNIISNRARTKANVLRMAPLN